MFSRITIIENATKEAQKAVDEYLNQDLDSYFGKKKDPIDLLGEIKEDLTSVAAKIRHFRAVAGIKI